VVTPVGVVWDKLAIHGALLHPDGASYVGYHDGEIGMVACRALSAWASENSARRSAVRCRRWRAVAGDAGSARAGRRAATCLVQKASAIAPMTCADRRAAIADECDKANQRFANDTRFTDWRAD